MGTNYRLLTLDDDASPGVTVLDAAIGMGREHVALAAVRCASHAFEGNASVALPDSRCITVRCIGAGDRGMDIWLSFHDKDRTGNLLTASDVYEKLVATDSAAECANWMLGDIAIHKAFEFHKDSSMLQRAAGIAGVNARSVKLVEDVEVDDCGRVARVGSWRRIGAGTRLRYKHATHGSTPTPPTCWNAALASIEATRVVKIVKGSMCAGTDITAFGPTSPPINHIELAWTSTGGDNSGNSRKREIVRLLLLFCVVDVCDFLFASMRNQRLETAQ